MKKKRGRKVNSATSEARFFVGSGSLRAVLEMHGYLSTKAINKIVEACIFVLKA
jgi:hypothetical protein